MDPATTVDPTAMFTSMDAYVTVLAVVTIVTLIKHSIGIIDKKLLDKAAVKLFLEWSGPLIGGCSAFVPGLWDDYTTGVGVMVAAPCGFLAERIYKSVLAKLLPGLALTSDHREKKASDEGDA